MKILEQFDVRNGSSKSKSASFKLDGLTGAAKALGGAATDEFGTAKKRVMSAAARAKISAAAKRRWAKVKAGAKKAVS